MFPIYLIEITLSGLFLWLLWPIYSIVKTKYLLKKSSMVHPNTNFLNNKIINEATRILAEHDENIHDLNQSRLADKNIGGKVVVQEINFSFDDEVLLLPEHIGLIKIEDENSLVNLAKKGVVSILDVQLGMPEKAFTVHLKVKNNTEEIITSSMPKGQIFENKEVKLKTQNLASKDYTTLIFQPLETKSFEIDSFCYNQLFGSPDGAGNITIFELRDKDYKDNSTLWQKQLAAINENKRNGNGIDFPQKNKFSPKLLSENQPIYSPEEISKFRALISQKMRLVYLIIFLLVAVYYIGPII